MRTPSPARRPNSSFRYSRASVVASPATGCVGSCARVAPASRGDDVCIMLTTSEASLSFRRSARPPADRLKDKDASDVVSMMQTSSPREAGATLAQLRTHPVAGEATTDALEYLNELFGRRAGEGVRRAAKSPAACRPG